MRKFFIVLPLLIVILIATASPAFALWTWCSSDPGIKLPGNQGVVHLMVAVPSDYRDASIELTVTAPAGSRLVGNGYGHPVEVNLAETPGSGNEIVVSGDASYPVRLSAHYKSTQCEETEFIPDGIAVTVTYSCEW